jgi:hypothetical protein
MSSRPSVDHWNMDDWQMSANFPGFPGYARVEKSQPGKDNELFSLMKIRFVPGFPG